MIEYSLGLVTGYVVAKALTPHSPSLLTAKYHIHHWIWATAILVIMMYVRLDTDSLIGIITGVALQGLSYDNWSIKRKEMKE